jgi:hypothetical protein
MRFELNFAAVVRNVAVMANAANLAVDRFVAIYHQVLHALSGYRDTKETEQRRFQSSCDPCDCPSPSRLSAMGYAYVIVPTQGEISKRWRQEQLLSKPRG